MRCAPAEHFIHIQHFLRRVQEIVLCDLADVCTWRQTVVSTDQLPAIVFWGFSCDRLRTAFPNLRRFCDGVPGTGMLMGTRVVKQAVVCARLQSLQGAGGEQSLSEHLLLCGDQPTGVTNHATVNTVGVMTPFMPETAIYMHFRAASPTVRQKRQPRCAIGMRTDAFQLADRFAEDDLPLCSIVTRTLAVAHYSFFRFDTSQAALRGCGTYMALHAHIRRRYGVRAGVIPSKIVADGVAWVYMAQNVVAEHREGVQPLLHFLSRCVDSKGVRNVDRHRNWVTAAAAAALFDTLHPTYIYQSVLDFFGSLNRPRYSLIDVIHTMTYSIRKEETTNECGGNGRGRCSNIQFPLVLALADWVEYWDRHEPYMEDTLLSIQWGALLAAMVTAFGDKRVSTYIRSMPEGHANIYLKSAHFVMQPSNNYPLPFQTFPFKPYDACVQLAMSPLTPVALAKLAEYASRSFSMVTCTRVTFCESAARVLLVGGWHINRQRATLPESTPLSQRMEVQVAAVAVSKIPMPVVGICSPGLSMFQHALAVVKSGSVADAVCTHSPPTVPVRGPSDTIETMFWTWEGFGIQCHTQARSVLLSHMLTTLSPYVSVPIPPLHAAVKEKNTALYLRAKKSGNKRLLGRACTGMYINE